MLRILVTGANGFVGRSLCPALRIAGFKVRGAIRDFGEYGVDVVKRDLDEIVCVGDIDSSTEWSESLAGIDAVIHLAARVHILQEVSKNPLESFRSVNVKGSERLARAATMAGVRRLIYVSSILIHGNFTEAKPYSEDDAAHPHSPYAVSKWEGELALRSVSKETGLELVTVRPPLVYGPGVGGNFLRLMCWAEKGWPLPLASIHNLRSFIGIDNLVDLLVRCVDHPKAANEVFLAADGEDLSTPDLIRRVAKLLNRPARLLPFPVNILRASASVVGMDDVVDRLCNSLQVDSGKARRVLGWQPGVSLDEGFARTAEWYATSQRNA